MSDSKQPSDDTATKPVPPVTDQATDELENSELDTVAGGRKVASV